MAARELSMVVGLDERKGLSLVLFNPSAVNEHENMLLSQKHSSVSFYCNTEM